MAQLDPTRYKRLSAPSSPEYGKSYGTYYDQTSPAVVIAVNDTIIARIAVSQISGRALVSDGTDFEMTALEGDSIGLTDDGYILIGDGVGSSASPVTGDATLAANGVLSLADTFVRYTSVAVSSAELLAINATPKTIVAAPGAGFTTIIHRALLVLDYNSAAYANNGILGLYETDAAGTLLTGTLTLASFLAQTADTQKELHPTAASATTGMTRLANKAVVLTQATGESITGDSPVDVHCWYSIVPHGL